MERIWIVAGGLAGFGAVGMAAAGSHVLTGQLDSQALHWVDVAVQIQGWHALALVLCGVWAARIQNTARVLAQAAGAAFLLGTVLFCGALYLLALNRTSLGPAAPTGGLCLMAGWFLLALSGAVSGAVSGPKRP